MANIRRLLGILYGQTQALEVEPRMRVRMKQFAGSVANRSGKAATRLNERDALLITYADQVRDPGEPPLRTLADFCGRYLKDSVSGLHLLPFYPSSSDDGFSVKDFCTVEPAYGAWEDVERLGDDFDLMFDGVFNHVSAQSEWFQRFLADDPRYRDFFISVADNPDLSQVVRPRALPLLTEVPTASGPKKVWTTFSADQADLNFKSPEVLLAVLEALLFYVAKGARFIRLDAIAFLWKEIGTTCLHLPQTHRLIQLMRAVLDEVAPHVLLITETNVPHAENISYFGDGTNEAQLVYNFALAPLLLHTLQTGNAEKLTQWAQSLAVPSDRVTFFNFLASHDGIGLNPARGILSEAEINALVRRAQEHGGFISYKDMPDGSRVPYELNINYLDALSGPGGKEGVEVATQRFLTAHAIMLSLQGIPGIYFHSLFGSRGDRAGAEASGIPRRINRQKLERVRLEEEVSRPDALRGRVFGWMKELLRVRRGRRAFHPHGQQEVMALEGRVFAVHRSSPGGEEEMLCIHNVSGGGVSVCLPWSEAGGMRGWETLVGLRQEVGWPESWSELELGPYQTVWLGRWGNGF